MGSQSPRRPILRWSATDKLGLLMVCLLVAIFSSYKLLAVPDLKPGDIAQVNVIAPRDAKVIDTTDLKEKKQSLKESYLLYCLLKIQKSVLREQSLERT